MCAQWKDAFRLQRAMEHAVVLHPFETLQDSLVLLLQVHAKKKKRFGISQCMILLSKPSDGAYTHAWALKVKPFFSILFTPRRTGRTKQIHTANAEAGNLHFSY
jgi:hypothetical protein